MVRSTFTGFSMAQLALGASQKALDVTGQNISNINTKGYTRQRLDQVSIAPQIAGNFSSPNDAKVGMGVMITGVSQIRDPFLDRQYRTQLTKIGTADAIDSILAEVSGVFDESNKEAIKEQMSEIVKQIDKLSQPGQSADDNMIRSSMAVLLNYMHQNAKELEGVEKKLVDKMNDVHIKDIQLTLENISKLNKSIKSAQILGDPALELKDQRNVLLDDLSTYFPIKIETPKVDLGGGVYYEHLRVTFEGDGENVVLVDGDDIGEVSFTKQGDHQYTIEMQGLPAKAGDPKPAKKDVTAALKDGVLKGNMQLLNEQGRFDEPQISNSLCGLGYYEKTFDLFANALAVEMNKLNGVEYNPDGTVVAGTEKNALFTTDKGEVTGFTAANIMISEGWSNGSVKIKHAPDGAGSTANENLLKMVGLLSDTKITVPYKDADGNDQELKTSLFDLYAGLQNNVAIDKKSYEALLKNRQTVAGQASDLRDSVVSVNLDEEVMNIMRYQQSYSAASRMVTAFDQMLERLITNTGVVGR